MLWKAKLKGSALVYVLIVSLVLTLMTLAVLASHQYYQKELDAVTDIHRSVRNAESGLLLLMRTTDIGLTGPRHLDLFEDGQDSITLSRRPWGVYEILSAESRSGREVAQLHALVGSAFPDTSYSLLLEDNGKPLSLCGETRIEGRSYLPKSGVKRAYIEGKNYVGSELIYGQKLESPDELSGPDFSLARYPDWIPVVERHFDEISVSEVTRTFDDSLLLIWSEGFIDLSGIRVSGHVKVQSDVGVRLTVSSTTENSIIEAPVVHIEDDFKGSLQVFADSVFVGKNVQLHYPAALVVQPEQLEGYVSIGEHSTMAGVVIAGTSQHRGALSIGKGCRLVGEAIVHGATEVRGSIEGQLTTKEFTLRTASATYRNHLLDATISVARMPGEYVGYRKDGFSSELISMLQ